jgi:prolyl 4-hydroxylase
VEECQYLIDVSEKKGYLPAKGDIGRSRDRLLPAHRKSERCQLDSDNLAAVVWERIKHTLPAGRGSDSEATKGVNERFRFLKYNTGDFFVAHRDAPYVRGLEKGSERYTFVMIFMNLSIYWKFSFLIFFL